MTTKNIIEGLTILEKYRKGENGYNTAAEHDQIHAYTTDLRIDEADLKRLVELGWFQEGAETAGYEFEAGDYDPSESWTCFV